ncbi:MAG: CapA family protein [Asgard group archaeon]|nr:CapA family protein [Asgard group archaeon]
MPSNNSLRKKISYYSSNPYNVRETLIYLWNNFFGPSKKYATLTNWIPKKTIFNSLDKKLSIAFIGDILPLFGKNLVFHSSLKQFLIDADYLVGNFEGVIPSNLSKGYFKMAHSEAILDQLANLKSPEKFLLNCANNHAGDFHSKQFFQTVKILKEQSFKPFGFSGAEYLILENKVAISSYSTWMNKPFSHHNTLDDIEKYYQDNSVFNILYPHWGYELYLYPTPRQKVLAKKHLQKWDILIGHHSHTPQPVTIESTKTRKKLVAYSLGNFCFGRGFLPKYHWGLILKITLGKNKEDEWEIGLIDWSFLHMYFNRENQILLYLPANCPFFSKDLSH